MGDPQNDSKWDWHQCGSNIKKTCCFSSQNFIFFFEKTCGFTTGKFRMKKWKKVGSKILWSFALKSWGGLSHVQYYCGILLWYQKNIPRVWSTSGHCVGTTAGYFFGNCPKFRPKWPKICERYRLYDPKCCSVLVQHKKKIIRNVFICFNIVPL